MPFLLTEPRRIEGTKLGFAVCPYEFDFSDCEEAKDGNRKLYIYLLKDSPFVEVEKVLNMHKFRYDVVPRNYVKKKIESFVLQNLQYITDQKGFCDFIGQDTKADKNPSKFHSKEKTG